MANNVVKIYIKNGCRTEKYCRFYASPTRTLPQTNALERKSDMANDFDDMYNIICK